MNDVTTIAPVFADAGSPSRKIAVRARKGAAPGVFWLSGFNSDMQGTKAVALDTWAREHGRACVRFDYSGHGESGGAFEDGTRKAQAGISTFPHVKWGTSLADFDNDGDRDLFIANGHFLKDIRQTDQRTDYRVANALLENLGTGRFVDVSRQAGSGLEPAESSRGAAFASN